jgi:muramidase (phage lysozyme)
MSKFKRKLLRVVKKRLKNRNFILVVLAGLSLVSVVSYTEYMQNRRLSVNPTTYAQLLHLIAEAESKGNYNAYFGNAGNSSIDFTAMPIAKVMEWQSEYVRQGNASSAVGKYQIIGPTLSGLVNELEVDTSQPFDQATQDRMAITLIERRGAEAYVNSELTREEFAANLAKEWAALPRVIGGNPDDSYYASDGLNKSLISTGEVLSAIEPIGSDSHLTK